MQVSRGREAKPVRSGAVGEVLDFGGLLQACPDAIWIQGGALVVYANAAALHLFGAAAASDLAGTPWRRLVAPECWAVFESHRARPAAEVPAPVARLAMTCLTLAGGDFAAESTASHVEFKGRPAVMWVTRPIAERKHIDWELGEQHARLERLVLERTAELRQALADARLSDLAKDAFLANVSHELRTPLSGMIGLVDLALKHCRDAVLREHLEKMARTGKHLSRIIDDLLDLSKVVAGRMVLEAIPFSLRETLLHAQEVIAHKADAKGLRLRFRADNDVPDALLGDPVRIEQILLNLVGNAIKFTASGRVDLHVSLTTRGGDHVRLAINVEDTGIGMTTEEISGLFQPFAQANAATTRHYGGTGLGLALSQRLAEAMGGHISVRSRKGNGSVFTFGLRLPLAGAPGSTAPAPVATPTHHDQARVLLVEDDPLNVEIVTEMLQAVGIYPCLAGNGHEAVSLLSEQGPAAFDLVLMDVQMPVMDGHAATRVIRSWPGFAALPIVAMTAHVMEHERQASIAIGMNDHLGKPIDGASFYALLDTWLPRGKAAASMPVAERPPPEQPVAPQSLHGLDVAAAIERFAGNEQRYRYWLGRFVEESPTLAPEVRRALAAGDDQQAAALVHSFKGGAGTLGLNALYALAAELEAEIRGGRSAVPGLRRLERAIDETRREINGMLGA